jgi:hypothetical protein
MGMDLVDLAAIPVHQLTRRRLRLGPFGSGRDAAKFLCVATVGALVAAVSSAVVWLPFLAAGVMFSLVRVEGRTLDDFALGYFRFQWRSSLGSRGTLGTPPPSHRFRGRLRTRSSSLRAGGIPIEYLPPCDLQRLFEEWRSTLGALDRPIGFRIRGERFSPIPFLPRSRSPLAEERSALESYRELVHALLRNRYRRVVELTLWDDPIEGSQRNSGLDVQRDELARCLDRLGIPARSSAIGDGDLVGAVGACR